jgi:hypothetical protein
MEEDCKEYFGKYRGTVENCQDLQGLGRVQVSVPDVLGDGKSAWAMPSVPYGGKGVGFFAVPPNKSHVWVEFERGDPDYPIWSGCFWMLGEAPDPTPGPQQIAAKMLKTDTISLTLNDLAGAGGFSLEVKLPPPANMAKIEAKADGLTIAWGSNSIKLSVDGVSINGSNLKVLP